MATSPLDYILQGARKILDKGEEAFRGDIGAVVGNQNLNATKTGIAINTALGLPKAAKDMLLPTRGYTEQQLKQAKPTTKDKLLAIPKIGAEIASIGEVFGGARGLQQFASTDIGGKLADAGNKIRDFAKPKTAGQASAMRIVDVLTLFPVGSLKVTATGASTIAKTKNLSVIKGVLKKEIPDLADDALEAFGRVLVDVDKVDDVQRVINRTNLQLQKLQKATPVADNLTTNVKAIMETGKPLPRTPVLPSNLPPVASKVGSEANPLLSEAKKYKRAEEFVNNKINVFHATNEAQAKSIESVGFKPSLGRGFSNQPGDFAYFTPSVGGAIRYSKTSANGLNKITSGHLKGNILKIDGVMADFEAFGKAQEKLGVPLGIGSQGKPTMLDIEGLKRALKENGYSAIEFKDRYSNGARAIAAIPEDVVTKSQLTDIWNKANKAAMAKMEPPKIRQMKTSAEIPSLERTAEMQGVTPVVKPKAPQKQTVKLTPPSQVASPKVTATKTLSTGEERTLEKLAQQQALKANQVSGVEVSSLPKIIQQQTPVSKKVGLLDYIRTPENVLKKIGLEKESKLIRDSYEAYVKELPTNIQKITDWSKRVSKESNRRIFRYLDNQAIDLNPEELKVAGEIKGWLAEWADRLGLPKDNRIAEYITHIFDDQLIKKEFDEDLAKIIADKIPGSVYNPFLEKRLGAKGYIEDTWRALDAYVKRATRKVHMDKALERLEEVSSGLEESQWKYIKRYADRINMRPTEADNLIDNQLKQIIGYKLGQRPVANISRVLRQTTFRGMLGANLGSALRNLTQGANTYAKLGEKYTAIGYKDLLTKGIKELKAEGILDDSIIQDRTLSATKKAIEKLDKGLFFFFDTAEKINRGSAYYGAKAKALSLGKTEAEAIEYAKKIVRDTQFQYGAIDTPVAMNSDIVKVMTQFMTYPIKQTEFLAGMAKNKEYMGIARYVLGGMAVVYTIGQVLGMKPTELIPFYDYVSGQRKFGVPPSLKFPAELLKAGLGTKDKFGQERDLKKKLKDVTIAGAGLIPGGIQAKKTLEGSKMVAEGGSFDKSGKLQFEQGQSPASKLQSVLFGKYAGKEAREFFDKGMKAKAVIKTEKELAQEVLSKLKSGEFGSEAVAEEYLNSELKKIDKAKKEERFALPPKEYAQEVLNLLKAGKLDEATAEKELNSYLNQPEIADRTTKEVNKRGKVGLVLDYGKAFTIDPGNAWKALTTSEKLGIVEGNLVEMARFKMKDYNKEGGSEEYKKKAMAQMGLPWSEAKNYKLEHIVPVKAGGDTSANNLLIVTNDEHNSYTRFDTKASKMVQDKQTTRKKVTEIAIKLKIDKTITVEEALNML